MTIFPAGAAPNVPVVAPAPIRSASARALAASRLITSMPCPALAPRPPIAAAMPPDPMMLIVLMCGFLADMGLMINHGLPAGSGDLTQHTIHASTSLAKRKLNAGILLACCK